MPYKDTSKGREYHKELMRRRRADASADKGANLTSAKQSKAADPGTPGPQDQGQDQGKCIWSVKDICILFLSQNFKPIRCYGFNRLCEGKVEDLNTIPFKQSRENNDKAKQLAL